MRILTLTARTFTPATVRSFAALGKKALQAVLEARKDLRFFEIHRTLAPAIARLPPFRGTVHSLAQFICKLPARCTLTVQVPWHAARLICVEQQGLQQDTWACSPSMGAAAVSVDAWKTFTGLPGMGALRELTFHHCVLVGDWLPTGSASCIERRTYSSPHWPSEGMVALKELAVDDRHGCLRGDWLPTDAAARIEKLRIYAYGSFHFPKLMDSLRELGVQCPRFASEWLPIPIAARIEKLDLSHSGVTVIPDGMGSLRELNVDSCEDLQEDWLPALVAERVEKLDMVNTPLTSVPEGMQALRELNVSRSRCLRQDWLPILVAERIEKLNMSQSWLTAVPKGMQALRELNTYRCMHLVGDWLPTCSVGRIQKLSVPYESIHGLKTMSSTRCIDHPCELHIRNEYGYRSFHASVVEWVQNGDVSET
jgi:hypothetical protein